MSSSYIPKQLRLIITELDRHRCSYCLTDLDITGIPLEIDHILPRSLEGQTIESNLCLACSLCNDYKGDEIAAIDPLTNQRVAFFDPRQQLWKDHFEWSSAGDLILGRTPTGRATIKALKLNRKDLANARLRWVSVGWHPPKD